MRQSRLWATLVICVVALTAAGGRVALPRAGAGPAAAPVTLALEPFLDGLDRPVNLVAGGLPGDGRLFIVQQGGKILIVNPNGTVRAQPFLDITGRVDQSTQRTGLFGLVFHPDYADNGYFYLHYIHRVGNEFISRLSRFKVTADANVADPGSENILLTVTKQQGGHNAGDLQFGPDGYLYFPLGDGDSSQVTGRSQDPTTLLGKMARINVDDKPGEGAADCKGAGSGDYSIPPSNPLAGSGQACDEIWASGLRNPWRFSFDRQTGDLYLSDVGEMAWDELNFAAAGQGGGRNYGWPCHEADAVFEQSEWPERGCDPNAAFTFPVVPVAVAGGDCSLIGGFVYRGSRYPDLIGRYIMTDYCSGRLRDVARAGGDWVVTAHAGPGPFGATSFGQGNDGELYVVNREENAVYRVVGDADADTPTPTATKTPGPSPTATPSPTMTTTPPPGATATPTATPSPTATEPGATPTPAPTGTLPPTPEWSDRAFLPAVLGDEAAPTPPSAR